MCAGIGGTTTLVIGVALDGLVEEVRIERSSRSRSLDRAAMEAARRWKFQPALVAGAPVSSKVRVPVVFDPNTPQKPGYCSQPVALLYLALHDGLPKRLGMDETPVFHAADTIAAGTIYSVISHEALSAPLTATWRISEPVANAWYAQPRSTCSATDRTDTVSLWNPARWRRVHTVSR